MRPLEKYLVDTAANLAKESDVPSTLEQRIAIGLVQARAHELRHLAGELQILGVTKRPEWHKYYAHLIERSSFLEELGLKMCEQYPPNVELEQAPMISTATH